MFFYLSMSFHFLVHARLKIAHAANQMLDNFMTPQLVVLAVSSFGERGRTLRKKRGKKISFSL